MDINYMLMEKFIQNNKLFLISYGFGKYSMIKLRWWLE